MVEASKEMMAPVGGKPARAKALRDLVTIR
jgi:hypothetical protein